jgi:hypothetical protein
MFFRVIGERSDKRLRRGLPTPYSAVHGEKTNGSFSPFDWICGYSRWLIDRRAFSLPSNDSGFRVKAFGVDEEERSRTRARWDSRVDAGIARSGEVRSGSAR